MTDDSGAAEVGDLSEGNAPAGQTPGRWSNRLLLLIAVACATAIIGGIGWILVTGLIAKADLEDARGRLPELRQALLTGDDTTARRLADEIRDDTTSAHDLVSGPAWWVGANLPWLGTPLQTSRAVAASARDVGTAVLPPAVDLAETLRSGNLHHGASIDVPMLARAARLVARAETQASDTLGRLSTSSASSWLGVVDHGRSALLEQLTGLQRELAGGSRALDTALPMLGEHGTRRYFVAFENEAEARGLGGLPGSYAIVTVTHGTFRFTRFGNDIDFDDNTADVDLGTDYANRYRAAAPTRVFENSTIGPDFRDAAQIWAAMYRQQTGQRIDGSVALDPTALSHLLKVTGPAPLPGGDQVDASNVVYLTQAGQYAKFPDTTRRKQYVVAVARAIASAVTSGRGSATDLIKQATFVAGQRRLMLWSADPREEQALIDFHLGGVWEATRGAFSGFTVVNAAGSKLDFYLHRTISYTRATCGATTTKATITLRNAAPTSGLPAYVTFRADKPRYRVRPGDNHDIVTYYATPGSRVVGATLDGKPVAVAIGREHGLVTVSLGVEVPAQRSRTVTVRLAEPAVTGATQTPAQPLVRQPEVSVRAPASCG